MKGRRPGGPGNRPQGSPVPADAAPESGPYLGAVADRCLDDHCDLL